MPDESNEREKRYPIWRNAPLGKPPRREEFLLNYRWIDRAILSFTFEGEGTKLDPNIAILINDKGVPSLDLPADPKSTLLEFVSRKDVEITYLLRTSMKGESNTIELNYTLSMMGIAKFTQNPEAKVGTVSLDIVVYPSEIITYEKVCIWCRKNIPPDLLTCPYCYSTAEQIPGGYAKRCPSCHWINPLEVKFCVDCGTRQVRVLPTCICTNCSQVIATRAHFCTNCGKKQ